SQCANSSCGRPLTSLSEGRLYQFEIVSISISATDDDPERLDETPHRETAHFWLCGACAKTMTLALEPLSGLRLLPIQPKAAQTCARSTLPKLQDSSMAAIQSKSSTYTVKALCLHLCLLRE